MDVPSIELAAVLLGGLSLGAVLAAVNIGLSSLGEAGLQALAEAEGPNAALAEKLSSELSTVQARLLMGRVLCVSFCAAFAGYTLLQTVGAGAAARLSLNPFEAMTTVTVKIVSQLTGDTDFASPETLVAFALGMTLFVLTLGLNVFALYIVRKYREQYD